MKEIIIYTIGYSLSFLLIVFSGLINIRAKKNNNKNA
jgi:hypothetical protein